MPEFSDADFEILDFINENEPVDIKSIKARFSGISSLEYRIKAMAHQVYGEASRAPLPNSSLILQKYEVSGAGISLIRKPAGIYVMTDYGRKLLQDHKKQFKMRRKELWLKNAWIPILVSIATTLAINGLKWLWPLLQRLVSNFP